eukprot:CAMPEP_0113487920 /NCGR_PEP_ID=MMETSP0014_2-20120614/25751_1 /TAXON_ID=2857 /ORGANISM="Nitzschia sp." /LENGTH=97 /DNA_ID=CAMNT_0000381619 /DNA_START=130 /DNA_END=423 /DNA_ORIENTATION=+ /assembly_acc=CAM_ASM_000159
MATEEEQEQQEEKEEVVAGEFIFTENTKAMYDDMLSKPPFFVRFIVRSKVNGALTARGCGKVTEQIMYDVIKETTPENMLQRSIDILDEHRTNPDAK